MKLFAPFSPACLFAVVFGLGTASTFVEAASLGASAATPAGASVGMLVIPSGLTTEEVREIAIYSLVVRKYTLLEKSDTHAVGHLINRGHEATIALVIRPSASIEMFCDGYAVRRNGERKKPEVPHGWINNLKNDLTRRMAIKLAIK